MIRIVVADDHAILREGLKRILGGVGDLEVVGEAGSGPEAVDQACRAHADVVLLDVSMPGRGGLETVQELKRRLPSVRVLMLTGHPEDEFAIRCLREGADGYLTKESAPHLLVEAVRKVHAGRKYVSPALAELLAVNLDARHEKALHERLSGRELEILRLIASGQTVGEIGVLLHLSVKTVSTYRARILEKTGLRNNAAIVRYAVDHGLDA
jgi:DNA-binding NarL/FixJ family response regulator